MAKNIALVAMVIVTVAALLFGFYQKTIAMTAIQMAEASAQLAQEAQKRAVEQTEFARKAMEEADRQRTLAQAEVERLKGRK